VGLTTAVFQTALAALLDKVSSKVSPSAIVGLAREWPSEQGRRVPLVTQLCPRLKTAPLGTSVQV